MAEEPQARIDAACHPVRGMDGQTYQQHSLRIIGRPGNRLVRFTLMRGNEICYQLYYQQAHDGARPEILVRHLPWWWRPVESAVCWRPYHLNDPLPGEEDRQVA